MPPKKPFASVIDLTDDSVEEYSKSCDGDSDVAIIRTLVANNGLTSPLPVPSRALDYSSLTSPLPLSSIPLPITSSPSQPSSKNRNFRNSRNFTVFDEVTVVKTVTLPTANRKKTLKPQNSIVIIPSDSPAPLNSSVTERKCPVCFDAIQNPSVTLCGHVYCTDCIKAAVSASKQCPICRKKLTSKGFHPLYL